MASGSKLLYLLSPRGHLVPQGSSTLAVPGCLDLYLIMLVWLAQQTNALVIQP
ncbi:hypothetical protein BGX38DRAFT_1188979 [Terfezia claveryi]|nr:hypothetical protein BGX38DRAFT_1188979 [Terfezia claveryi]